MPSWTFKCYVSPQGIDEIGLSYNGHSIGVRATFDSRLRQLSQSGVQDWRRPLFDKLQDENGLCEIRFKADGVQHRILGFFQPGQIFVMVIWMTKKGNVTVPKSAIETAKQRKREIERDGSRAVARDH